MKLLLDTNALIWWLEDHPRLGPKARRHIANPENSILASVVSLWEITMKWRVGKMKQPGSSFGNQLADQEIALLGITQAHLAALDDLPFHHRDPYDHMILAQAKVERARIVTSDEAMTAYGVPCIDTA